MTLKLQKKVFLSNYSTFKIGGPADYFKVAKNEKEIVNTIKWAKEKKVPFFILGGGSNVLFSDEGFRGLVIKIENTTCKIKNKKVIAGAGCPLQKIVRESIKRGLAGLEWAAGIPGTLGGAIYGNAGAFGGEMKKVVAEVNILEVDEKILRIKKLRKRGCRFGYRESIFKKKKNWVILGAVLKLKKGNKEKLEKKIKEILETRIKKQPLNYPSAGSVFKNVPLKEVSKEIQEKFKEKIKNGFLPAGVLIERAGLKGKIIGGAKISEKHANFIVNFNKAKTKDVLSLILLIKERVKKKFKIVLQEENEIVPPYFSL